MSDKTTGVMIMLGIIAIAFAWGLTDGFAPTSAYGVIAVHVDDESPTVNDDIDFGYGPGWFWIDPVSNEVFVAVSTSDGASNWDQINGGGGSGYTTIEDEDVGLAQESIVNFTGAGVICTAGVGQTDCTIAGSGGSAIIVQEDDSTIDVDIDTVNFDLGFDVVESPENKATVSLDYAENPIDVSSSEITGIIGVGNGGTGQITATEDGFLVGNGSIFAISIGVDCTGTAHSRTQYDAGANLLTCDTSQIDISAGTNLVAGVGITLTGDSLSVDLGTSIDSSEIDADTIVATDIATGGVGTLEILNNSIISEDIATDTISSVDVATGAIGTAEILDASILLDDLNFANTPVDEECLTIETSTNNVESQSCGVGGSGDESTARFRAVSATNNIYPAGISDGAFTGFDTIGADTLIAIPIHLAQAFDTDALTFNVAVGGGGGSLGRMCIYEDNGSVFPGDLNQDAGTVAVDSTGYKTITFTEKTLTAGLYWLAFFTDDATVEIFTFHEDDTDSQFLGFPAGEIAILNWGWTDAETFGSCPDPYPVTGSLIDSGVSDMPFLGIRLVP